MTSILRNSIQSSLRKLQMMGCLSLHRLAQFELTSHRAQHIH
ncbi:MAG: hypothetical protein ACKO1L_03470 [Brachymonas sp.]